MCGQGELGITKTRAFFYKYPTIEGCSHKSQCVLYDLIS